MRTFNVPNSLSHNMYHIDFIKRNLKLVHRFLVIKFVILRLCVAYALRFDMNTENLLVSLFLLQLFIYHNIIAIENTIFKQELSAVM